MWFPLVVYSIVVLVFNDLVLSESSEHGYNPNWNETWTDRVKRNLFPNYDKTARPAQHYDTTNVFFDFVIHHVSVDEFQSTLTLDGWSIQTWVDNKLKWDPANYGGIKEIHIRNHDVWKPDLVLYNSGVPNMVEYYGGTNCLLFNDGKVLWVPPTQFVAFCTLNLRLWPFDTQVCSIKVGSWTYDVNQINLQYNTPSREPDMLAKNSEWSLINIHRLRNSVTYPCCENPYIDLEIEFTLQRNSCLYYSILIVPAIAVIFLTLVTFWLPSQSELKVVVASTTTLIIVVILVYFSFQVPLTKTTPLIVFFFSHCLCLVTISLVSSALVINISRRSNCKPLPRNIRMLLLSWPGKLLGISDPVVAGESRRSMAGQELRGKITEESSIVNSTSNISEDADRQGIFSSSKNTAQTEWILVATAIDRIMFFLFCIILCIVAIVCMY